MGVLNQLNVSAPLMQAYHFARMGHLYNVSAAYIIPVYICHISTFKLKIMYWIDSSCRNVKNLSIILNILSKIWGYFFLLNCIFKLLTYHVSIRFITRNMLWYGNLNNLCYNYVFFLFVSWIVYVYFLTNRNCLRFIRTQLFSTWGVCIYLGYFSAYRSVCLNLSFLYYEWHAYADDISL